MSPTRRRSAPLLLLLPALSCRTPERSRSPGELGDPGIPADSLALTGDDGVEVWFTLARVSHASDGKTCVERGLEIRRGDTRVPVPLLYTGATPVLTEQSTLRAELWNHCRPVDTYLVDLRSGRPVREKPGSSR
jgi:hypothetical protein